MDVARAERPTDEGPAASVDAGAADIPAGTAELREVAGRPVLVARTADGRWFAVSAICSHVGLLMEGARVRGDAIICPHHGVRFCLATGGHRGPPATQGIEAFPARVAGGRVMVGLA